MARNCVSNSVDFLCTIGKSGETVPRDKLHSKSVNGILSLVSALLLDTEVQHEQKLGGIENLEGLLGLPRLTDSVEILSPTSKSLILYLNITEGGVTRLTLTTYRTSVLSTCRTLLSHAGYLPPASLKDTAFVICPYFRTPYGLKRSEGFSVEEGEGLGPRKEMFHLLKSGFEEEWKSGIEIKGIRGAQKEREVTVSVGNVAAGNRLVFDVGSPSEFSRTVTRAVGSTCYIDAPLPQAYNGTCLLQLPAQPLVSYRKENEKAWPNASLPHNAANEEGFVMLGVLLGLTVVNQCQMDFNLPDLFFKVRVCTCCEE